MNKQDERDYIFWMIFILLLLFAFAIQSAFVAIVAIVVLLFYWEYF